MTNAATLRSRFLTLHTAPPAQPTPGVLVMPNPWDVGSAKLLAQLGAAAIATTSAGHAGSNGRLDQDVQRDELLEHVEVMTAAADIPLNVDSEDCFGVDAVGVAETAALLAGTAAAGFSIEDYDPQLDAIRPVADAAERVEAAKRAGGDLVLTARAENHLYGAGDLDDTIHRLEAYRDAGADVVYAPGLTTPSEIERAVAVGVPVNVLALPGTPTVPQLGELGVARVSVGSLFAWAAYGAMVSAATELFGPGTSTYANGLLDAELRDAAFS
ncbi:MAG: isocitrate lyase/phosphoenolpyruvate mutase family protein [Ilumatobacter sp.]